MAAWCLHPDLAKSFLEAIRSGAIDPDRLMDMTSDERRAEFARYVGEDNAKEVNAQFESKMLLVDQKRGMISWAQKVGGITEATRRDIVDTINKLDRVLQPEDEKAFLADLAAKKLGVTVTAEEARTIYNLSQKAEQARQAIFSAGEGDYKSGWTYENGVAYGRAKMNLTDAIESMKPNGQTLTNRLLDVLSLPKTALTSVLHFSAPFVQGWGMMSTKNFWQGCGKMLQYFADEENYKDLNAWIISHPDYEIATQAKLGLTKLGDKLSAREESIQSSLLEQANAYLTEHTGVPNVIRASSRGFTGYLNYVRFSRYSDLLNAARLAGEDVRPGTQATKDIARAVDDFTGRGQLGKDDRYSAASPVLNALFFAPRKIAATVQMFNPVRYMDPRLSPTARQAAMRQLLGSVLATSAVLGIAKAMGASVDPDPRSSDFAKIVIDGEKLDMTGGNDGYVRLLARIFTNQTITAQGVPKTLGGNTNRAVLVANYLRGKLAPIATMVTDALVGKNQIGQPFSITSEIQKEMTPIVMDSFINYFQNVPVSAATMIPALSAIFGVGLETPLPSMSHTGLNVWGEPLERSPSWGHDPVDKAVESTGLVPNEPRRKIRGVELTPDQFYEYSQVSGRLARQRIESITQMPGWDSVPPAARLSTLKAAFRNSREMAAQQVMLESMGSQNDIIKQATAAKMSAMGIPPQ